ncbi:DUF3080 family protein [Motiliproteus sp. MSK22-1]|uniref:DUF3080 family protein n=1 Tax=Motiliproteus sp. MSK22-1 TaxID=1897630 RepID=UPI000977BB47|nr:DUF3080 family protein [Motiliproteus sp. MSK22-1]OMH38738.1 hypothetical protein BGP75_05995 [Motiliproteus sp. MSK22-1]
MPKQLFLHSVRLILLSAWVLLYGCDQNSPEAMLEDYLVRVSNSIDQEYQPASPYAGLIPLPPRRERRIPTTELRSGLLETLGFSNCNLLPLIAKRNSSLGKVMKPSVLMRYELDFFERLHPCYERYRASRTSIDLDFFRLLEEVHQVKSDNLEAVVWNGIFTSEAMEKNFSLSQDPLPVTGNPGFGDSLRALQQFDKVVESVSEYRNNNHIKLPNKLEDLEQHYFAIYSSEYGSQLIKSLALLSYYLNLTANVLEQRMERRPLCFNQTPTESAKILKNVFIKYYSKDVQPYMALVQKQGSEWLKYINKLINSNRFRLPVSVQHYQTRMLAMDAPEGLWSSYQRSIKRHTQAWQKLLTECGLMPGV